MMDSIAQPQLAHPEYLSPEFLALGAVCGLILTIFYIVGFIRNYLKRPKLEVRLTKESFFRLSEYGECLFANAVLIAHNGPIEIREVGFRLIRGTGQDRKEYSLSPLYFGEKVQNDLSAFAEHHFYTQSAIEFISENVPRRIVYLNVFNEKKQKIVDCFNEYLEQIEGIRPQMEAFLSKGGSDLEKDEIRTLFKGVVETVTDKIFDLIQLEEGNFELNLNVKYKSANSKSSSSLISSKSKISFKVDDFFRNSYKINLRKAIVSSGQNLLSGKELVKIRYPEYTPANIEEL